MLAMTSPRDTNATRSFVVLVVTVLTAALVPHQLVAEDRLTEIIDNIARAEALYDNIDVTMRTKYTAGEFVLREFSGGKPPIEGFTPYAHVDKKYHFVGQGEFFRAAFDADRRNVYGSDYQSTYRRAFDGEKTRLLTGGIGNIGPARRIDGTHFWAHTMLQDLNESLQQPLSTFFSDIKKTQNGPDSKTRKRSIEWGGEAEYEGLRCEKVVVLFLKTATGETRYRREYWIAPERTFMPVRTLSYDLRTSDSVAEAEGALSDYRELKPGVWFPFKGAFTAYNREHLKATNQRAIQWQRELVVDTVSLTPAYDISFFRDVDFPDGTKMYELDSANNIIHSYVQGGQITDETRALIAESGLPRWALWVGGAAIVIVGIAIVIRRKQKGAMGIGVSHGR